MCKRRSKETWNVQRGYMFLRFPSYSIFSVSLLSFAITLPECVCVCLVVWLLFFLLFLRYSYNRLFVRIWTKKLWGIDTLYLSDALCTHLWSKTSTWIKKLARKVSKYRPVAHTGNQRPTKVTVGTHFFPFRPFIWLIVVLFVGQHLRFSFTRKFLIYALVCQTMQNIKIAHTPND